MEINYQKIKDVQINDKPFMILKFQNIQIKKTTSSADYASLLGYDSIDMIEVKIWSLPKEKKDLLKNGEIYVATGVIKDYQGKKQFNVSDFYLAGDDIDKSKFFQYAPLTIEEIQIELSKYIKQIKNKILYDVVTTTIKEYMDDFFTYPAAISIHHSFISGLSYHVYSMLKLSEPFFNLYKYLNKDLVIAGIILHDIGKIIELSGAKGVEYTKKGNLLGHITLGVQIVNKMFEKLGYKDSEEALLLEHIIISHHGCLEYGSPKEPLITEAYLVYLLDLTDSRMASLEKYVNETEKGETTEPIFALDRKSFYIPNL